MANQIALPFGDHLEEGFCVSQNFFQRHRMCLGTDLSRGSATTDIVVAGAPDLSRSHGLGFVVGSLRSDPICRRMMLKKVLTDTKMSFQLIPERQRIPIRYVGDRAAKKCQLVPRNGMVPGDCSIDPPSLPQGGKGWNNNTRNFSSVDACYCL